MELQINRAWPVLKKQSHLSQERTDFVWKSQEEKQFVHISKKVSSDTVCTLHASSDIISMRHIFNVSFSVQNMTKKFL